MLFRLEQLDSATFEELASCGPLEDVTDVKSPALLIPLVPFPEPMLSGDLNGRKAVYSPELVGLAAASSFSYIR